MKVKIGKHKIGASEPCFIIAEVGINHNGRLDWALEMLRKAKKSGADAVKIQTFRTEKFMHPENPEFRNIKSIELSFEEQEKLFRFAKENKIILFSTPEDHDSVDFLEQMDVPAYKIASMDMDYYPFLEYVAKKKRPIFLSTGMASLREVEDAVKVIHKAGNSDIVLLHCVSNYPAEPSDVNLMTIDSMKKRFDVPVGFSDHTIGDLIPFTAVALGADVIEKHFTLDKGLPGDDHISSVDPVDLERLVTGIRTIESSMGSGVKSPADSEKNNIAQKRRGLYARKDINAGEDITMDNLDFFCPGNGVLASDIYKVIGRKAKKDIGSGKPIEWDKVS